MRMRSTVTLALLLALTLPAARGIAQQLPATEALVTARTHFGDASVNAVTFRSADAFFPTERVAAASRASALPRRARALAPAVTLGEAQLPFEDALRRTYTNALLVMKDGAIVDERYLNGGSAKDRYLSWSMAKSITSILVGIAIDKGMVRSVDDPIDRYVPETRGTAYAGVTIDQLLRMQDGTSYSEQAFTGESTLDRIKKRSTYENRLGFTDLTGLGIERAEAPGTRFHYSTLASTILGRLVEEASGLSLAAFTEKHLWKPAGMEGSAYWLLDRPAPLGRAIGGAGFNATLRDYGRLGQMMLDGGRANGRQIVSRAWVEKSTRYPGTTPLIPGAPRGYGYQWWTMIGTVRFEAIGIHGQFLSVDPATRTVIVKLSHWPEQGGRQYNLDALALMDTIRAEVSAR